MNGTSLAKLPSQSMHLGELLVAAVHVAGHDVRLDDLLAVQLGDHAQRAVGGGVLRTEVERHALVGLELDVDAHVGRLAGDVELLLALRDRGHSASSVASSSPGASPGMGSTSTMPGHGFTTRASSG
jgi:hypothetical protein